MTPKDKALQLIGKFAFEIGLSKTKCPINCAIITVEEIIDAIDEIDPVAHSNITASDLYYWEKVKQELLKIKDS